MPTVLEQALPVYDFTERHHRRIEASPESVWNALTTLTMSQLAISRFLMAIRHPFRRQGLPTQALLTHGPVRLFASTPPRYAVGGVVSRPWQRDVERRAVTSLDEFRAFTAPGWVKYLTDFRIDPVGNGVVLSTETRGCSTDKQTRRRFALYWVLIRFGSGLVRADILRSVARAATGPQST